jgi:ATP-dependent Lon protease
MNDKKALEDTVLSSLDLPEGEASSALPEDLFLIPLNRRPFFPGMAAPLIIEKGKFYDLLKQLSKSQQKFVGLVLTRKEDIDLGKANFPDLYKVGVLARILRIIPMEQGGAQIVLNIEKRFTIKKKIKHEDFLKAKVKFHEDPPLGSKELKAYSISIINTIKELLKLNPLFKEELQVFLTHSDFTDPGKLADFSAALTTGSREELQEILETFDIKKRIDKALLLLKKELDLSLLLSSINDKIENNISQSQREFFLREQLRAIKRELGIEKEDRCCDLEKFEERLSKLKVPEDAQTVINEEIEKLQFLDVQSSEYTVSRNYLDWLTMIPWGVYTEDNFDISDAEKQLNKDHYGLKDIKERILEFIGVGKLSGRIKGSIICLVGPPGVGKTSIGKSIAKAIQRKFFRFSVGGMRDEAEIKGHRRTYVGAMPGKMIQALKVTQTMNPVVMLDEVDKMGASFNGDPASALLEVLDREQNNEFLDHYLDTRCDLSEILFITTANVLEDIPPALRDRMDILRLPGYIGEEKLQIAKKFLIPKYRKEMGLLAKQVKFTDKAICNIINGYAREAGVRSLENLIKKILRKVALKIVQEKESTQKKKKTPSSYTISPETLKNYLGNPIFTSDRYYKVTPCGVCMGLAWTSLGGATLYIEAVGINADKTTMKLTGQAGDVMKESSQIAWSVLSNRIQDYIPSSTFFEKKEVHLHIPEGATPKDGPSAGITMLTALISLLSDTPVLPDLSMTGELTLTGRVLAIGGMKEKVIAARRSQIKTIIFPEDNKHDFEELPDYLKEGIDFHFVRSYDQVFPIAFPSLKKKIKKKK